MDEALLSALRDYIDAAIAYEFACRDIGADGYTTTPINERREKAAMWERLMALAVEPDAAGENSDA